MSYRAAFEREQAALLERYRAMAKEPCPAWSDGAHCYATPAEVLAYDSKWSTVMFADGPKRCVCGAIVERSVPGVKP